MSRLVPEAVNTNDLDQVNFVKVTREILAMLAPTAVEKHIDLEFEHEDNLPNLISNSASLGILIRNLVDNAIRYCKENGKVLVHLYKNSEYLILEVCDNGPGIPIELQSRVFERFFRVLGNKSPGSGLGLAIVKQICDIHNASVELDTPKHHSGLIVRVLFPLEA